MSLGNVFVLKWTIFLPIALIMLIVRKGKNRTQAMIYAQNGVEFATQH
jgi:hypothetical protein